MPPGLAKRLPAAERRAAIIRIAADVFFEQGYAATSIDAVIEQLGGSKRSIYNEFGSKEGLFTSLVSEIADSALADLQIDQIKKKDLRETLTEFGCHMMRIYTAPPLIGVYRSIVTEAQRFPDLVRTVYERGPARATQRIAEVLETAVNAGKVRVDDCELAAAHLIGMLRGNLHLGVVLGLRPAPSEEEINIYVASIIDIFLNGLASRQLQPKQDNASASRRGKSRV
jgi:AcrR family transcriptional regulator